MRAVIPKGMMEVQSPSRRPSSDAASLAPLTHMLASPKTNT